MESVSFPVLRDGHSSGSIYEGDRVTAERRKPSNLPRATAPALIPASLSWPKRSGFKTALRCVLPPLIKTILPSTGRSDFSSQGRRISVASALDQQAAAVDRQCNAVDVSVLHQK